MSFDYIIYSTAIIIVLIAVSMGYLRSVNSNASWWWLLPLFIGMSWNLVSLVVIEYGFFITEQATYSVQTGAAFRYLLFLIPGVFAFRVMAGDSSGLASERGGRPGVRVGPMDLWVLAGTGLVVAVLIFNAALSPAGWSGGVDRFNWWENSRYPWLQRITGTVCWPLAFSLGILLARFTAVRAHSLRTVVLVIFVGYLWFLVWMGQKFNGLTVPLLALFLPMVTMHGSHLRLSIRGLFESRSRRGLVAIVSGAAIASCFLGFLVYRWFDLNTQTSGIGLNTIETLFYRAFILQGHSYYGADYIHFRDHFPTDEVLRLFAELDYSGILTVMNLVGDTSLVESYTERGVRYATIHPSFALMAGVPVGALGVSAVIGGIVGLAARWFRIGQLRNSMILQFCAANLVFRGYGLFMMSDVSMLISLKFLAPILIGTGALFIRPSNSVFDPELDQRPIA